MSSLEKSRPESFQATAQIHASQDRVWQVLTEPALMLKWMGDSELELDIETNWKEGQPFITRGFHHVRFQNRGIVLRFDPPHLLRYSHLSSISRLADKPENYSVIEFTLQPVKDQTSLTITVSGFPTSTIYKHLEFYWRGTIGVIKQLIETQPKPR
jgi:uncharacterized protein YndB with AHSA1/START domain